MSVKDNQEEKQKDFIDSYTSIINSPASTEQQIIEALKSRSSAYQKTGQMEQSMQDFKTLLGMPSLSGEERCNILIKQGNCHFEKMNFKAAIESFSEIINDPSDIEPETRYGALINRGNSYCNITGFTGRKMIDKAIDDYTIAIEMEGITAESQSVALIARARLFQKLNKLSPMLQDLKKLSLIKNQLSDRAKSSYYKLKASYYYNRKKPDLEIKSLNQAVSLCPENSISRTLILFERARTFEQLGKYDRALTDINEILSSEGQEKVIKHLEIKKLKIKYQFRNTFRSLLRR